MDIYDIGSHSWTRGPDRPGTGDIVDVACELAGSGRIITVCRNGACEIYDTRSQAWTAAPAVAKSREAACGVSFKDSVYLLADWQTDDRPQAKCTVKMLKHVLANGQPLKIIGRKFKWCRCGG